MFNPMKSMANIAAIVLAAGKSTRYGGEVPKPYLQIAGKTILDYSIERFCAHPMISSVVVVIAAADKARWDACLTSKTSNIHVITGGHTRQESVRMGLQYLQTLPNRPGYVLIHDGARPNLNEYDINHLIMELTANPDNGVILAQKITDSLHRSNSADFLSDSIDRDHVWAAQTPQAFAFDKILAAHKTLADGNFTDDAALAKKADIAVKFISATSDNFKITTKQDFEKFQYLMEQNVTIKTGYGYDVHPLVDGNSIILGGIKIIHHKSLSGHSDADVVLHALVDALLGTCAGGDIGVHFPPSEARWKNQPSRIFLEKAKDSVTAKGGKINNIDITIIAEEPKITPYRQMIQNNIAEILNVPLDHVNIKATTAEKMGFIGRGEGIATHAIATVQYPKG